jgi:hypothetical protein
MTGPRPPYGQLGYAGARPPAKVVEPGAAIPSRPVPSPSAAPLGPTPLPDYRVLVADTRTGLVLDDLPIVDYAWSDSVDWGRPGSGTFTVPLTGEAARTERDLITRSRSVAGAKWKVSLCLVRGADALWAGPLIDHKAGATEVSFGCGSLSQILAARMALDPAYLADPLALAADLTYQITAPGVAAQLFSLATIGPARELPIEVVTDGLVVPTTALRTYPSSDLAGVSERLKALTEEDDGPDIRIRPRLTLDQKQLSWQIEIGNGHLGLRDTPWVWDYPSSCTEITEDGDGSAMLSLGYYLGDGLDRDRIIGISKTTALTDQGWPALERTNRDAGANPNAQVIDGLAASYVDTNVTEAVTWAITVDPEAWPQVGLWSYGDNGRFDVRGHPWIPDGDYRRRLLGVNHSPGKAVLETADPLPEVA